MFPGQRGLGGLFFLAALLVLIFGKKRSNRSLSNIGLIPFVWIFLGAIVFLGGATAVWHGINLAWPPIAATQQLGKELKVFSQELVEFADERKRAETMLPHSDKITDSDVLFKEWRARVDFSHETESLFNRKFGNKWARYLADLKQLGINPPFQVTSAISHNIPILGKYIGVMGSYLEENKVKDAQETSKDETFWFRQ